MPRAAFQLLASLSRLIAYQHAATVSHNRFIATNGSEFAFILMPVPIHWQFPPPRDAFVAQRRVFQSSQADRVTA